MKGIIAFFITGLFFLQHSMAQNENKPLTFVKNNFSKIVSKNTRIQKIADGFKFTEGPVWHKDGYLLFSDIPSNKIMKYAPDDGISVYLENSGFIGSK